jgi:hypothetical protein
MYNRHETQFIEQLVLCHAAVTMNQSYALEMLKRVTVTVLIKWFEPYMYALVGF